MDLATYARLGLDQPTPAEVNGRSNADIRVSLDHPGERAYNPCSEAFPGDDTAAGSLTRYRDWDQSRIYPDTLRDLFVYLPARLDPRDPVDLLVCNDGVGYSSLNGAVRATRVLDTLHARNEIRQTLGIFVNPGRPADTSTDRSASNYQAAMRQRSLEYDALTPDYGNFLESEVLAYAGYDHRFEFGTGGHSLRHGGAIFADSLRWLWRSSDHQSGNVP